MSDQEKVRKFIWQLHYHLREAEKTLGLNLILIARCRLTVFRDSYRGIIVNDQWLMPNRYVDIPDDIVATLLDAIDCVKNSRQMWMDAVSGLIIRSGTPDLSGLKY